MLRAGSLSVRPLTKQEGALLGAFIGATAGIGGALVSGYFQLRIERLRQAMAKIDRLYEDAAEFEDWGKRLFASVERDPVQRQEFLREQAKISARLRMVAFLYVPRSLPKARALTEAGDALERMQSRYEAAARAGAGNLDARVAEVQKAAEQFLAAFADFHAVLGAISHEHMGERPWYRRVRSSLKRTFCGARAKVPSPPSA